MAGISWHGNRPGVRACGFRVEYNAPAVLTFTGACVLVWLMDCFSGGWLHSNVFCINHRFSLTRPSSWPMLLSHAFGHVDYKHLLGNMSHILLLGTALWWWRLARGGVVCEAGA